MVPPLGYECTDLTPGRNIPVAAGAAGRRRHEIEPVVEHVRKNHRSPTPAVALPLSRTAPSSGLRQPTAVPAFREQAERTLADVAELGFAGADAAAPVRIDERIQALAAER